MAQQGPAVERRDPTPAAGCRHHWVIEAPNGATSRGTCKICGEAREFRNSSDDHFWEHDSGGSLGRWRNYRSTVGLGGDDEF